MKKYFIVKDFRRLGPFSLEELKNQNITEETIIWTFEGGEKKASEIPEINDLLKGVLPQNKVEIFETKVEQEELKIEQAKDVPIIKEDTTTNKTAEVKNKIENTNKEKVKEYKTNQKLQEKKETKTATQTKQNIKLEKKIKSGPTYLIFSLINLLVCMPLGVIALIYSYKAKKAMEEGFYYSAETYAKTSLILNIIGLSLFFISILAIFI